MNFTHRLRRRTVLASVAGVFAAPALVLAGDPIPRAGRARFKFSLAAYSYRGLLRDATQTFTLEDFILDCARFGLQGTELTSYYFPETITREYLLGLRNLCFRQGLDVSGTAIRNDFGRPFDAPETKRDIEHVKAWIDHARWLGAPVIRIFAGHAPKGVDPAKARDHMVDAMQHCCEYAGQQGVFLALENHGGPTATSQGLLELVRRVDSPWFGVNLDSGNFRGDDVYDQIAEAAPFALNVQVKVVTRDSQGRKRPTDFVRLAGVLKDAGYQGYIVLEFEESGDPRQECPRYLDVMRSAFA